MRWERGQSTCRPLAIAPDCCGKCLAKHQLCHQLLGAHQPPGSRGWGAGAFSPFISFATTRSQATTSRPSTGAPRCPVCTPQRDESRVPWHTRHSLFPTAGQVIKQVRTRLCTPPQKRRDGVSIRRIRCEVFGGFHSNAFIFLLVLIPSSILCCWVSWPCNECLWSNLTRLRPGSSRTGRSPHVPQQHECNQDAQPEGRGGEGRAGALVDVAM